MKQEVIEKLVTAILLSSLKKGAEQITMRCERGEMEVTFLIDGREVEELRPTQPQVHDGIFEWFARNVENGRLHLCIADERDVIFRVTISGMRGVRAIVITRPSGRT